MLPALIPFTESSADWLSYQMACTCVLHWCALADLSAPALIILLNAQAECGQENALACTHASALSIACGNTR